jgi:hypothetical protein
MRETPCMTMFGSKPWPFGRPSYLGSKPARACERMVRQLSRQCGTQAMLHSRGSSARYSFRMTTNRNRPIPSGKWAPIPANIEAVREHPARNREWPKRMDVVVVGGHPGESLRRFRSRRRSQLAVGAWGSCGQQTGKERSESNRKRLSVCKGTREAQPSRVIAWIGRREAAESSPMRRLSGGASVVVRERESRLHGEGRQDVSCWMTEGFVIREGSR